MVHCCQWYWADLTPIKYGGAAKEGERMSTRAMSVGEGQGVSLEVIRRGYIEVTWRESGVSIGSHGEE